MGMGSNSNGKSEDMHSISNNQVKQYAQCAAA